MVFLNTKLVQIPLPSKTQHKNLPEKKNSKSKKIDFTFHFFLLFSFQFRLNEYVWKNINKDFFLSVFCCFWAVWKRETESKKGKGTAKKSEHMILFICFGVLKFKSKCCVCFFHYTKHFIMLKIRRRLLFEKKKKN